MHIFEKNVLCHRSVLIYNNFNKFVILQNENMQQIVFTAEIDSVINVYNVHQSFFFFGGGQNLHFIFTNFTQISTDACVQKKNKYEFENLCFLKCLAIKLSSCFSLRHLFDTNIRFTILKSRDRVKFDNWQKDK